MSEMKVCVSCGIEKPLDDFHRKYRSKDGHNSYCKECANAKMREWRRNNVERSRMHGRISYMNNIDRRREYGRAYYYAHREYFAEYGRKYRMRKKAAGA